MGDNGASLISKEIIMPSAREIAEERFAKGEITEEER